MTTTTYAIREEDRQALVLALAKLSLTRPGWKPMLRGLAAGTFRAGGMFDEFASHGPDTPTGTPLGIFERVEILHSDDPDLEAEGDLLRAERTRLRAELRTVLEGALETLDADEERGLLDRDNPDNPLLEWLKRPGPDGAGNQLGEALKKLDEGETSGVTLLRASPLPETRY